MTTKTPYGIVSSHGGVVTFRVPSDDAVAALPAPSASALAPAARRAAGAGVAGGAC